MRIHWGRILPTDAITYRGLWWPAGILLVYNIVGTVRSCTHILAPDSGASSIASMTTEGVSGPNVIDLLGQWGGAQLLEAAAMWIVLFRYRALVPLALAFAAVDQVLRIAVGEYKPIVSVHTPPGALSKVVLPVLVVAFVASLIERRRARVAGTVTEPTAA